MSIPNLLRTSDISSTATDLKIAETATRAAVTPIKQSSASSVAANADAVIAPHTETVDPLWMIAVAMGVTFGLLLILMLAS
jgi:hypothetical protein